MSSLSRVSVEQSLFVYIFFFLRLKRYFWGVSTPLKEILIVFEYSTCVSISLFFLSLFSFSFSHSIRTGEPWEEKRKVNYVCGVPLMDWLSICIFAFCDHSFDIFILSSPERRGIAIVFVALLLYDEWRSSLASFFFFFFLVYRPWARKAEERVEGEEKGQAIYSTMLAAVVFDCVMIFYFSISSFSQTDRMWGHDCEGVGGQVIQPWQNAIHASAGHDLEAIVYASPFAVRVSVLT